MEPITTAIMVARAATAINQELKNGKSVGNIAAEGCLGILVVAIILIVLVVVLLFGAMFLLFN